MAKTLKTTPIEESKSKKVSETGLQSMHASLRDQRKTSIDTKLQLKLGRIKNTSLVKKQKKEIARSLTKLNASRIIASLKK